VTSFAGSTSWRSNVIEIGRAASDPGFTAFLDEVER
jgi:hypothetical protein